MEMQKWHLVEPAEIDHLVKVFDGMPLAGDIQHDGAIARSGFVLDEHCGQAERAACRLQRLQQSDAGHGGGLIVHAFDEDARGGDGEPLRELLKGRIEFEIRVVFESEFGVDP